MVGFGGVLGGGLEFALDVGEVGFVVGYGFGAEGRVPLSGGGALVPLGGLEDLGEGGFGFEF